MPLGESLVKGFAAGSEAMSKEALVREKQTENYNKVIGNVVKSAAEIAKHYTSGENTSTPEEFSAVINKMMDDVSQSSALATRRGYNVTPPEQIEGYRQMLLKAATPRQLGESKGTAEGAGLTSKATAIAGSSDIPLTDAQTAVGARPKDNQNLIQINTKDKILLFDTAKNKIINSFPISQKDEKTSTSVNTVYRLAAGAHGGIFDQLGNLVSLDPKNVASVQAVTDRAMSLLGSGEAKNEAEAVTKALRESGKEIPSLGAGQPGAQPTTLPPGLPEGTKALPDGSFQLPDGRRVKPKQK